MSGDKVLLDTNAVIALSRDDTRLMARLESYETLCVSLITLGELYFGAANSNRPSENYDRIKI